MLRLDMAIACEAELGAKRFERLIQKLGALQLYTPIGSDTYTKYQTRGHGGGG